MEEKKINKVAAAGEVALSAVLKNGEVGSAVSGDGKVGSAVFGNGKVETLISENAVLGNAAEKGINKAADTPKGQTVGGSDGEKDSLEFEIQKLKEENARQRTEFEAAIRELRIKAAVEDRLRSEGAKNPRLLARLMDISEVGFDEKGGLIGIDGQIEELRSSEGYLFEEKKGPLAGCFRPEEAGDFSETSRGDFSRMTYSEMIRALGK